MIPKAAPDITALTVPLLVHLDHLAHSLTGDLAPLTAEVQKMATRLAGHMAHQQPAGLYAAAADGLAVLDVIDHAGAPIDPQTRRALNLVLRTALYQTWRQPSASALRAV